MRIRLVHWNEEEARKRALRLRALGHDVVFRVPSGPGFLKELARLPPRVVVIDLARAPSRGRDLALSLRERAWTRAIPLVLVKGDPEKTKRARELLPDATFATWSGIERALKHALSRPARGLVRRSRMDAYRATPLAKKLGIGTDFVVCLVGAPPDFEISGLPPGAALRKEGSGRRNLTLWFVRAKRELESRVASMSVHAARGGLWILWPKKQSEAATDLSQVVVRRAAESLGLVDFKVAAIDDTWSGLRFTLRTKRGSGKMIGGSPVGATARRKA